MAVAGRKIPRPFSSSSTMGSEEDINVYCKPCDKDGPRLPAHGYCVDCREHLCDTCLAAHKKHTLSRHHTLLDKNSMPQTMSQVPVCPSQPDNLTKPCAKHRKEIINFYCQNHTELLCRVCVTLEHTSTSCKVKYIPEISDQVINSKEHHDILKAMDSITEQCCKKSEDVKENINESNSSLTVVLADIKKFRKEINQTLDELEREAEAAAKTIQQENKKNLKAVETTCDDVTKSLKTVSHTIKHLNTSKEADKLFVELKLAEQMMKDYERQVNQLAAYDVKTYNFKPNKSITTLLDKGMSLGRLTYIKIRQVLHVDEICVKTIKDAYTCHISGMTLLTPDLLIITDWLNCTVKMVDTCCQSISYYLRLDDSPWDVTSVTNTRLAVTLPGKKYIQFISVFSNKLKKKQYLKVDGECRGISCCQEKIAVSFLNPAKLQILNSDGTVLTTVKGENIFRSPYHITTNTNSIYVSDSEMLLTNKRFNWQGRMIGSYGGMQDSRGITLTYDGTLFICGSIASDIIEIASDLYSTKRKVLLKNLIYPYAICWCAETNTLYTSRDSGLLDGNVITNFLHVFKLT